ncbi:MAG: DUF1549 domain-containing protein, partial [Planctomycetaceae bacterium]|nr:DUF1549 domain-containing protein [Planctomycetaceae bacterium]
MADRTFLQQLSTYRDGGNPPAGRWRFVCLTLALLALPGILVAESAKKGTGPESAGQTETGQSSAPHWAFQPVERPPVPAVRHLDQVQTPIDAFIVHRLEAAGLSLSPPASWGTLIRRLSYDLRGLPATPEETDRFLADGQ